jgi:hypothetical protein
MEAKMEILIGSICFIIGIIIGRKSRKFPIQGKGAQDALAFFLLKEIVRHREDIVNAKKDLRKLAEKGYYPPLDLDLDVWLEVK